MNETKDNVYDVKVDGNTVRFVRMKKKEKLHDLFKRTRMLDLEIGN